MAQLKSVVIEAGKILKDNYFSSFKIHEKEKGHLAAEVDLNVELFLKEQLFRVDPSAGFYGEETGGAGMARQRWIVDSLDGTANFIFGVPYFCTSVALEKDGVVSLAMVYNPVTEELFEASDEIPGAYCNGRPIEVSTVDRMMDARIVFGFSANYRNIHRYHSEWGMVFDSCQKGLGLLSPAMNLCNVARGRIDAFIDFGCSMEGQAAGGYILQKAGGQLLNYDKCKWDHCETGIVATNGCLELQNQSLLVEM